MITLPPQPINEVSLPGKEVVVGVGKEDKGNFPLFLSVSGKGESRKIVDKFEKNLEELSKTGKAQVDPGYRSPGDGYQLILGGFSDLDTMRTAVVRTFGDGKKVTMIDLDSEKIVEPSDLIKEAKRLIDAGRSR